MLTTPNYALKKIELTDSPPDITVLNDNFDTIDAELKENADTTAAHLTDYVDHIPYVVATGSANTYAVTLNPAPTAYADGMAVCVKINVASTGASTLNINGLGAKTILDSLGNAITSGGLKVNTPYTLRYNGTNFIVQGKGGGGTATADKLLTGYTATVDTGQINGSMVNQGSKTYTPNANTQSGGAGYYSGVTVNPVPSNFRQIASGTTLPGSSVKTITETDGTNGGVFLLTVTGLTFKPSLIIAIRSDDSSEIAVYYNSVWLLVNNRFSSANGRSWAPGTYLTIPTSTSFVMAVTENTVNYNWVAYA